jgi:hypothetical protein
MTDIAIAGTHDAHTMLTTQHWCRGRADAGPNCHHTHKATVKDIWRAVDWYDDPVQNKLSR